MPKSQTFSCPSCGAALTVPPDAAKEIKCPYCGSTVIVPKELRSRAAPAEQPAAPTDLFTFLRAATPPLDRQETLLAALAIVVFGCVAVVAVLNPFSHSNSTGSPELAQANATAAAMTQHIEQQVNGTRTGNARYLQPLLAFGGAGTAPGLFQDARYVAVDSSGNIYVADGKTKRISKFDSTGKYQLLWFVQNLKTNTAVSSIEALSADATGKVYVTADNTIFEYDGASGILVQTFAGHKYTDALPLAEGGVIATATDQTPDDLVRLDPNGKQVWYTRGSISSQPDGKAPSQLRVAIDGLGNIFALQNDSGEIYKFTPDGKFVTKFGSKGGQPGQFNADGIRLIALDNASNVYVSDFEELYAFDASGRFLQQDNAYFMGVGGAPRAMTITGDNRLVLVQDDNKIYILPLPSK